MIGDRNDLILGHEALGVVDEVGSEVKDFKPGDRVIVPAITPDWDNEAAQRGCPSQSTGPLGGWKFSNFKDRVFAEYFHVNMADANFAKLPEGMSLEAVVMIPDMLSTGFRGTENATMSMRGTVAVLGIGPVRLSAIAGAKLQRAGKIFVVGTRPKASEVVKEYGATDMISCKEGSTDGEGVDSVIIAGGREDIILDAVRAGKSGSMIYNTNYFGSGGRVPICREVWGFRMADKDLPAGLYPGGRVRMERLADRVSYGRIDPASMATHVFHGFDKTAEALLLMKEKPRDLIKPVVIIDENL
ncbi:Succinate-semialdehyde dehydrogenase (acetylating) [Candidatus Methanobinarius endosymbioticus]|uniref:Succinate-semialdehyde dehydrogenase (Acetylating) n=1 Tax=Candidatus Methanobinarius endosymbioticus TaxID=2006182 RepID=A0A366MD66_9EURY|nr:Succinate-semialdehyde dehydrogenase (acetylating) [Candidatus Methanobinarius endosymbioticus]